MNIIKLILIIISSFTIFFNCNFKVTAENTDNSTKLYGLFIAELINDEINKAIKSYYGKGYGYSIPLKDTSPFELKQKNRLYEYKVTVMPHEITNGDNKIVEDIKGVDTITFEINPSVLLYSEQSLEEHVPVPIKLLKYEHTRGFKNTFKK